MDQKLPICCPVEAWVSTCSALRQLNRKQYRWTSALGLWKPQPRSLSWIVQNILHQGPLFRTHPLSIPVEKNLQPSCFRDAELCGLKLFTWCSWAIFFFNPINFVSYLRMSARRLPSGGLRYHFARRCGWEWEGWLRFLPALVNVLLCSWWFSTKRKEKLRGQHSSVFSRCLHRLPLLADLEGQQ